MAILKQVQDKQAKLISVIGSSGGADISSEPGNALVRKTDGLFVGVGEGLYVDEQGRICFSTDKWKTWARIGGIDPNSYGTLDALLADNSAMQTLMKKHGAVNYLADWLSHDIDASAQFLMSTNALTHIGLSDYAYDTIAADGSDFNNQWLSSNNWKLALKDSIPTMTGYTTPSGVASASSEHPSAVNAKAWNAFDKQPFKSNSDYRMWHSAMPTAWQDQWLQYQFQNPICVKRIETTHFMDQNTVAYTAEFSGSNDGTNWTLLKTIAQERPSVVNQVFNYVIDNDQYYLYYRYTFKSSNISVHNGCALAELQMYGRAASELVPVMTSNTQPYGVAFASSTYAGGQREPYFVFDSDVSNRWVTENGVTAASIGYEFTYKAIVRMIKIKQSSGMSGEGSFKDSVIRIEASSGTEWTTVASNIALKEADKLLYKYFAFDNDAKYLKYRVYFETNNITAGSGYCGLCSLQFYGPNYSEA